MTRYTNIGLKEVCRGALTGRYPVFDDEEIRTSDAIVALSFGTVEPDGSFGAVNIELAEFVAKLRSDSGLDLPVIAQWEVARSLSDIYGQEVDISVEGDPSSVGGQGLDSFGVLSAARNGGGSERPLLAVQAFHVGRVAMQAASLGMDPRLPAGLPREFPKSSEQVWTRQRGLWALREVPGMAILKLQGKI